jgi:chromosomal replication initiation ATPase DnaA
MAAIAEEVAGLYGVTVADLKARTRRRAITGPRQHAMAEMRRQRRADGRRRFSCQQIASWFGLKDHTTVCYAVRVHESRTSNRSASGSPHLAPERDRPQSPPLPAVSERSPT